MHRFKVFENGSGLKNKTDIPETPWTTGFRPRAGAERPVAVKQLNLAGSSRRTRRPLCVTNGILATLKPRPHPLVAFLILGEFTQYHRQDSRARQEETHLRFRPQQR
ncbi:hypothetical protein Q5P01_007292 [Channa striata]|uniref:Uncharacterized protein n=1 Tax=Channa striata TaxID=64152 RepID=A0AA88N826_CHASR|nr:hypothetical protein Q5P01_007292 [Channa striata]